MRYGSLKLAVRAGMVIVWLALMVIFLYAPLMHLFKNKKTITVLTWTDMIDSEILARFEKEAGVHVRLSYFENNEELFIKLLAGRAQGFDLIIPSDYIMEKLISHNLIRAIDRAKLNFWDRLNPDLRGVYFDRTNSYSIPYHWALYGLAARTDVPGIEKQFTWKMLFDKKVPGKIAMLNSGREAVALAAYYLFGAIESLDAAQEKAVRDLLIEQRLRVQAYVDGDMRAEYLLRSGEANVAVIASPFIPKLLMEKSTIDFQIPDSGGFIVLDSLVISAHTEHEKEVYDFINFLFKPEIIKHHFTKYPFVPSTTDLPNLLEEIGVPQSLIDSYRKSISSSKFFRLLLPENKLNELWMSVKV